MLGADFREMMTQSVNILTLSSVNLYDNTYTTTQKSCYMVRRIRRNPETGGPVPEGATKIYTDYLPALTLADRVEIGGVSYEIKEIEHHFDENGEGYMTVIRA